MGEIIAAIVVACLAGVGFLLRRWLRRESTDEVIARRLKLISLYQRMKTAKLDVDALERLEREMAGD